MPGSNGKTKLCTYFCSNEMIKFDAFVFELREAIRNDGTLMLTMRTRSEETFETGKDGEEYRVMKEKDDRILRNI